MGVIIYILPILIAIGLGIAQFDAGKRQIANLLQRALGPGTEVELGDFSGSPFDLVLDDLVIRDAEGVWLDLDEFRFRWAPSALLRGRLVVEEISFARIALDRLPEDNGEAGPQDGAPPERRPFEIPGLPGTLRGLVVERVAVDRLALGEAVLGEPAVFALDGRLEARDPQQQFDLALRADRLDEPTARLIATAGLQPAENAPPNLTIDLEMEETGGLFAALADLPDGTDLTVDLKGTAPVTDWHGRLVGMAGGYGRLDAALDLRAAANLSSFTAAVDGTLDLAPRLVPEDVAPLLAPPVRFALRLQRPEAGNLVVVERVALTTEAGRVEAAARFDLAAQTTEGWFDLRLPRLAALEGLARRPLAGRLTADGRFAGPIRLPEVTADLAVEDPQTDGFAASRFTGTLRLAGAGGGAGTAGLRLDGNGRIDDLAVDAPPFTDRNDFGWTLAVERPADGTITLRNFALTGEAVDVAASGRLAGEVFALDATVDVADLPRLAAVPADLPSSPRLRIAAEGRLGQPLTARVSGQLDRLAPLPPALSALAGDRVTFAADIAVAEGTALTLSDLSLSGQAADLTADAAVDLAARELQARFGLAVPRLAVLAPVVAPNLAGALRLAGEAGGPIDNPRVTTRIEGTGLVLGGQAFDRAAATIRAEDLPGTPAGTAEIALTRGTDRLAARTDFALRDRHLHLSGLDLDPNADLAGEMVLDLDRLLADGALRAESGDIGGLARFFDLDLRGGVAVDLTFEPEGAGQRIALGMDGTDLSGPFGAIGGVRLAATLQDAFASPRGEAEITATDLRREGARLDRLTAKLEGSPDRIAFSAEAAGQAGQPFDIEAAGDVAGAPDGGTLTLTRLTGRVAGEPLALDEPVALRSRDGGIALDERLSLTFAGARLEVVGGYGPATIDVTARITDLPLRLAERFGGPPLTGRSSARLVVGGTPQRPQAELALEAAEAKIAGPAFEDAPPLDLALDASLRDEELQVTLRTTQLFDEPVTARATVPLQLSLQPFAVAMPPSGAIEGQLQAEANLTRVASLLLLDDQRLDGRFDLDLRLFGTVAAPRVGGTARVADGSYQNLVTGTVFTGIDAALSAIGTEIIVERFTATDGGNGRVAASGAIDLAARETFPFAFNVTLEDAVLVRRDDVVAAADADLSFTGNLGGEALLSGDVAVGPAQVRIPERLPPSVVDLDVIEIDTSGEVIARPETEESLLGADAIRLRLDVTAERLFVRGRGLESEWEGDVQIAGTVAAPDITGQLEVQRGFVDFLDRRLDVTRGIISFPGARPPSPNLDVVATADLGEGVTAELAIRGDAGAPELMVTSQPELPQDEILARLLFGRDLSSITPVQAVRLAAALNRLRGGGGFDLLGQTRALLGVDVLDIRSEEQTAAEGTETEEEGPTTTIGVGKYITDEIFVEVERGLTADTGAVSVEIEVTPNVTIDTEVGADAQAGVGVKWRFDY